MQKIRNFCIIAHIDHGKSTLADRFLELTETVEKREMHSQVLDQMDLERERGITIKLQPVRMKYKDYQLNLIDTPGHVDFTYEVSRSLAACEGALLVVDATQGIEAQTLANMYMALEQDLVIIPVINKTDLPNAKPEQVAAEVEKILGVEKDEILFCSAKTGKGVPEILEKIIAEVPAPKGDANAPLKALIYDSRFDSYKGVEAYVRIVDGTVTRTDKVRFIATGKETDLIEVGVFTPRAEKIDKLSSGEVGYISTGLKELDQVRVGDTVTVANEKVEQMPGYQEPNPVVFAGIYPVDGDDYPTLKDALAKLKLSDSALQFEPENSKALGFGYRLGLLGLLHLEIVQARLQREYDLNLIITSPSVVYKITTTDSPNTEKQIYSPVDLPSPDKLETIKEPWAKIEIISPSSYVGAIIELICNRRGEYKDTEYLDENRAVIKAEIPLANLIIDFYDKLKSISQGYASMNYELSDYRPENLVCLDILVNKEKVDAFSTIVYAPSARHRGLSVVNKLKDVLPRQNFAVPIQAAIGGEIVARADLKAFRKDVTEKLYGGDFTRKRKLLEKQRKGKKRMKSVGNVEIPQKVFLDILKMED